MHCVPMLLCITLGTELHTTRSSFLGAPWSHFLFLFCSVITAWFDVHSIASFQEFLFKELLDHCQSLDFSTFKLAKNIYDS